VPPNLAGGIFPGPRPIMAFSSNIKRWRDALADPALGIDRAVMLQDVGSEFKRYLTLEPRRLALAADGATTPLIAVKPSAAQIALGTRQLVIPRGMAAKLEQVNYYFAPADEVDPADVAGSMIRPLFGGDAAPELPPFRLDEFDMGASSLRFGPLPVGIWIVPERQFTLDVVAQDSDGDPEFELRLDLIFRLEPRALVEAAGLLDPWRP